MANRSNPPTHLLEVGKQTHEFFNFDGVDAYGKKQYSLKPMDQYATEHRTREQPSKQYFKQTKLKDIIMEYPYSKKNPKQSDIDKGGLCLEPCISLGGSSDTQRWLRAGPLSTLFLDCLILILSSDGRLGKLPSTPLSLASRLPGHSR